MPHIMIEHSANVTMHHDVQTLVEAVHAAALDHGLAGLAGLRTRAERRDHWVVADAQPDNAFVAMHVRVGPGRTAEARAGFIAHLLDAAEAQLATEESPLTIAWSIEIHEIDPEFRINRNHVKARLEAEGAS